jgi:hypothetical protein
LVSGVCKDTAATTTASDVNNAPVYDDIPLDHSTAGTGALRLGQGKPVGQGEYENVGMETKEQKNEYEHLQKNEYEHLEPHASAIPVYATPDVTEAGEYYNTRQLP